MWIFSKEKSTELLDTHAENFEILSLDCVSKHAIGDPSISLGPSLTEEALDNYLERCRASIEDLLECLFNILPAIKMVIDVECSINRETENTEDEPLWTEARPEKIRLREKGTRGNDEGGIETVGLAGTSSEKQEMMQKWFDGFSESETLRGSGTPSLRDDTSIHDSRSIIDARDASAFRFDDEYEKLNSQLQVAWADVMAKGRPTGAYTYSAYYKEVSVLMLSWDSAYDDLGTKWEVDALADVFRNTYKFKVQTSLIGQDRKKPLQQSVNRIIANWAYENDALNSLLIVYFAGHATPGLEPGTLELTGRATAESYSRKRNKIM